MTRALLVQRGAGDCKCAAVSCGRIKDLKRESSAGYFMGAFLDANVSSAHCIFLV